ncbi:MAG: transposase [Polyangiaceae bacterium]|nr:transposase [Polyangiaceae bacterium]
MGDQIHWATELLEPIYRHLIGKALTSTVLHVDATSLPVKDKRTPRPGSPSARCGATSATRRGRVPLHARGTRWVRSRSEIGPETFLAARTRLRRCRMQRPFSTRASSAKTSSRSAANMHGRRCFVKALDAGDKRAAHPIAAFRALYDVEADARALDDDARLALRQSRSRPIYDELVRWCRTYEAHRGRQARSSARRSATS